MATPASDDASEPALSPAFEPPPGNPRFPLFDGLRAMAVLLVLAFHVAELTGRVGFGLWGRFAEVDGGVGVLVFFLISGFLLYRPYVAARAAGGDVPSTRRYARRRALRILPGYWFALTALAIFPGIAGVFSGDWWRYYGFLQIYTRRTGSLGIPVAWSLCVEAAFYIALPLWAIAIRRLPVHRGARELLRAELLPLAVIMCAGALVQLAAATNHISSILAVSILGQCTWLAIGMALAVASVAAQHDDRLVSRLRALGRRPNLCWALAAAALGGLMAIVPAGGVFGLIAAVERPQPLGTSVVKIVLQAAFITMIALPVIFGEHRRGLPRWVLAARPIAWLGVISYSFYLWHLVIAQVIALPHDKPAFSADGLNLLGHVHVARDPILFVVVLAATTVVASITYRFIELPFLRRK